MNEMSSQEKRNAATAANLRRAYGGPVRGGLPPAFVRILARLEGRPGRAGAAHDALAFASPQSPASEEAGDRGKGAGGGALRDNRLARMVA